MCVCAWGRGWQRGREPQAASPWVQSPRWGWISRTWGHDLSQNQESGAQPTESPRHPALQLHKNKTKPKKPRVHIYKKMRRKIQDSLKGDWKRERNSGHLWFEGFLQCFIYHQCPQFSELKKCRILYAIHQLKRTFYFSQLYILLEFLQRWPTVWERAEC